MGTSLNVNYTLTSECADGLRRQTTQSALESQGRGPNFVFSTRGGVGKHFLEEVIFNFNITFYFSKRTINAHGIIITGTRVYTGKTHFPSSLSSGLSVPLLVSNYISSLRLSPDTVLCA